MTLCLTLSVAFINAQTHCIEVPAANGLSNLGDSIILGGVVTEETFVFVESPIFAIVGNDTMGFYIFDDEGQYGLFMGNPSLQSGINVYKDVLNIAGNSELNIQSNYYTLKDQNQVHYVVYETGMINFGDSVNVFLNRPSYSSNAEAVAAGLPYGCLYFNTYTNSYSKVN